MPNGSAFRRWRAIRNYPAEPLCCNLPTDWLGTFPPFAWDHPPFEEVLVFDSGKQIKRICFADLHHKQIKRICFGFTPQTNQKDLLCLTTDHARMMPRQTPQWGNLFGNFQTKSILAENLIPAPAKCDRGRCEGWGRPFVCLPFYASFQRLVWLKNIPSSSGLTRG